jgi:hypothetical protein
MLVGGGHGRTGRPALIDPSPPPAPSSPAAPGPTDDPTATLRQLTELHAEGLLDDHDFALAQSKLLRRHPR